jgi:hypothetical protein
MKCIPNPRVVRLIAYLIIVGTASNLNACIQSCSGEIVLNRLKGYLSRNDRPLKNVTVDVFRAKPCSSPIDDKKASLKTNDAGYFDLGALPPGTYRMVFNIPNEPREIIIKVITAKRNLETLLDMTVPEPDPKGRMVTCLTEDLKFHVLEKS